MGSHSRLCVGYGHRCWFGRCSFLWVVVMRKHTPGPWTWEEGTPIVSRHWNGRDCAVAAVDWRTLAWHEDGNCAGRESGANARLISAAPDLLEVLELCEGNIASLLASAHPRVYGEWLTVVRAAIAKATGETK